MKSGQKNINRWQAFGTAFGLELALLGAALTWIQTHPAQTAQQFVALQFDSALPEVTDVPAKLEKLAPKPEIQKQIPAPVKTIESRPEPRVISTEATVAPAMPVLQEPVVTPSSTNSIPSPAPVAHALPTGPTVDPAIAYNVKLAAAVQAAFEIPATVSALGFKGRTQVEFNLRDGLVSAIRVLQSSGLGAADRAAVKAVQAAIYPPPPPALQGREGRYQIWVVCF